VDEETLLTFTATATDHDLPANNLTFDLLGAPTGAAIDARSGRFSWTPTEAQGAGDYRFTVRVTDDGAGNLSDEELISIHVNEVNVAPVLADIGSKTVDEERLLTFTATATDHDLPANGLTFSLLGSPTGAAIDAHSGVFTWTPTEAQGPADYSFRVRVTDNGAGTLFDEEMINVHVNEVNRAPELAPVGNRTVSEGERLSFTVSATDPDLPANTLMYSATSLPRGATFDASTRTFSWMPDEAQGPAVYALTFGVSDGLASDSETIQITVNEDASLDAGPQGNDGQADSFRIVRNGANVEGYLNGVLVFTRSFTSLAGFPLSVTGSNDNDTLTVDFSGGTPIPALGLSYQGGGQATADTLSLTGGTPSSVIYTATDAHSGSVSVDGALITYGGLEPINDTMAAASRQFVFGATPDNITLAIGSTTSTLSSPSSETITFGNPTGSLTVLAGGGNDTVNISGSNPSFNVRVDAGVGDNTVNATGVALQSIVTGTSNNDTIGASQSAATVTVTVAGTSTTRITGAATLEIDALAGTDTVTLGDLSLHSVVVDGGTGNDVLDATAVMSTGVMLIGGEGNDQLTGGARDDVLLGGAGNDVLAGRAGEDLIDGGEGTDTWVAQRLTPIAYWNLNEPNGTVIHDGAGTPQNGALYGEQFDLGDPGPSASEAPFGAGTSLDLHRSSNEYVAIPHNTLFEVAAGTVQLWFKTRDANQQQALFSKDHDGTGAGQLLIWIDNADLKVKLESSGTSNTINTDGGAFNNLIQSNKWYQLTFTFGPAGMKLYVDGALVGSNSYTGGLVGNKQPIVLGGSTATNRNDSGDLSRLKTVDAFNGWIDEVAVYGTALSSSEIAQTRARGAMAVTGADDARDQLVSIERTVYSDTPSANNVAPASQTTQLTANALSNTATFTGIGGATVDLGTFDGSAGASSKMPAWASLFREGLDAIEHNFELNIAAQAVADSDRHAATAGSDWIVLEQRPAADSAATGAPQAKSSLFSIDWGSVLSSFGLGRGGAKPAQPNIADFKSRSAKDDR